MIPIFVHHELDQKNQTGGAKGQQYVRVCIEQAKKYNEKVVLFGDQSNRDWCDEWEDVSDFKCERWERFLKSFENFSDYPEAWAKGIFKRFFVFEEYMKKNDWKECVILDSDVLTYMNFSEWEELAGVDVALEISINQRMEVLPYDNDLRWAVCVGVGYLTISALSNFIDFCIDTYENNKRLLLEKWNVHKKYVIPGGVCEMSLLYLWIKETDYKVSNIGLKKGNELPVIVANGKGKDYSGDKKFVLKKWVKEFPCVKLDFVGGIPFIEDIDTGKRIKVYNLHWGGKSKMFMKGIVYKQCYTWNSLLEWCYWEFRGKLSIYKKQLFGNKSERQRTD